MDTWANANAHARAYVRKTAVSLTESIKLETMIDGQNCQLRRIADELANSVAEAAGAGSNTRFQEEFFRAAFVEEQKDRLKEIISAIPSAFHHYSFQTTDGTATLFDLPPDEFLKAVATVKDEPTDNLKKAYGTVWVHSRVMDEVRSGQKSKAHQENCLCLETGGVEYVAQMYLKDDDFVSLILEWALVDAMVYARILDFANSRKYFGQLKGTVNGQLIDGPMLPGTSGEPIGAKDRGIMEILGQGLAKLAAYSVGEAIALLGTWWIASLIAGDGTEKWILFTGVTVARWVVSALRGKTGNELDERARDELNLQMLWDFCLAHERVPSMNIGLLRDLLYRLEERGAAFSPAVFAILDKRAKREGLR